MPSPRVIIVLWACGTHNTESTIQCSYNNNITIYLLTGRQHHIPSHQLPPSRVPKIWVLLLPWNQHKQTEWSVSWLCHGGEGWSLGRCRVYSNTKHGGYMGAGVPSFSPFPSPSFSTHSSSLLLPSLPFLSFLSLPSPLPPVSCRCGRLQSLFTFWEGDFHRYLGP